jgi:hypothetical protein
MQVYRQGLLLDGDALEVALQPQGQVVHGVGGVLSGHGGTPTRQGGAHDLLDVVNRVTHAANRSDKGVGIPQVGELGKRHTGNAGHALLSWERHCGESRCT